MPVYDMNAQGVAIFETICATAEPSVSIDPLANFAIVKNDIIDPNRYFQEYKQDRLTFDPGST